MPKRLDLKGSQFGRLRVLGFSHIGSSGKSVWECVCSCGKVRKIVGGSLMSGNTKSCGCYQKDMVVAIHTTHGLCRSPEYFVWQAVKNRCSNPNDDFYAAYGGRGITLCVRWSEFENFYADMGPRPSKEHSIDRIDNSGNYCPENCKWSTKKEQANNKRNNHLLEYEGVTRTVTEWAEVLGLTYDIVRKRLNRGWSVNRSLTTQRNSRKGVSDASSITSGDAPEHFQG